MKKILIVDDLKPFIEETKNILKGANVQIFTACSRNDAIEIHRKEKVDLIILDLNMPVMSGDEVCSIIRNDPALRHVSILMVIKLRDSDIERCRKCGAKILSSSTSSHPICFKLCISLWDTNPPLARHVCQSRTSTYLRVS